MKAIRHVLTILALGLCFGAVVAGCSTPAATDASNPYAAEIRSAQEDATSEFEKAALVDGVVTRDEYLEGLDKYVACVQDQGASVGLVESGGIFIYEVTGDIDLFDSVSDGCSQGTTQLIEPLYVTILADPHKDGYDAVIAECMLSMGVVEPPFAGADYADLYEREANNQANDPLSRAILDNPDAQNCMQNPGYARMQQDG